MKKIFNQYVLIIIVMFLESILNAQIKKSLNVNYFDEKAAIEQAISKGIKSSEINGYVQFLKNDFLSKKSLKNKNHVHSRFEDNKIQKSTIYLSPAKIASADCPNMGFENSNFSSWTGSFGTVSTGISGSGSSIYSITSNVINNVGGNNTYLADPTNYHTIVNIPAINALYPYCTGYDSIGCRVIGTNTISEIPVVSPFSLDGSSVRMNSANANYRACQLKYITTTSNTNKKLSYSFAFVSDYGGHTPEDSPYFKIEVKDETTGLILPGCNTSMKFNNPALASDSMFASVIGWGSVMYKKWQLYTVDLSSLPIGTAVSVNFEVGSCSQGGHFAYAYVDAECGGNGSGGGAEFITSNMCPGSTSALLVAPLGYSSYQWFDQSNNQIVGVTSNTLSISNPTVGTIYSVQLTSTSGCIETKTVAITTSSVSINSISTVGTCSGGNSGSATANVTGSNGTYSYTWTSISTGSIAGNSQTAINLSPGNYSVNVSSGTCGQTSATVTVPIATTLFSQQSKTYCGNNTFITTNNGTNYQWYIGSNPIPAPNGTNDTLFISNPINGYPYTVVYTNTGNCKDSIKYTLNQITGGYVSINNINNTCLGNSNGSCTLTLNPLNPPPYSFSISSTGGTISNTVTNSTIYSASGLSVGTYTSSTTDGNCLYTTTFTISPVQTNFTITPGNSSTCSPADTARINFNFGNITSGVCTQDPSICANSAQTILFPSGPYTQNGANNYPTPYGNYFTYGRTQYLIASSDLSTAGISAGKISSLGFNVLNLNSSITSYPNFNIKMGCTSINAFSNVSSGVGQSFIAGMQTVYSNANQPITLGWQTYNFPESYIWDGVSNIIVEVCFGMNNSPNYSQNISVELKQLPYVAALSHAEDASPVCNGNQLADNNSMLTNGQFMIPNMQFGHCSLNPPSSYTISVSSNGTIVQNYNNDSIKVVPVTTPTADIVYTITVTNPDGGCTASQTFTMSSNLAAYISYTNASCGSCPTGSVQVIVSCGTGPYNYVWSPGGQTTQSLSGLLPGCYTVTVTDATLNSVSKEVCITFTTKLEETSVTSELSIFPNPSNGIFNLLSETTLDKLELTVYNTLGQTIIQESLKNSKQASIDLSKLSNGIYYLKANTDSSSKLFKLILE
jgi:hypothetical protein